MGKPEKGTPKDIANRMKAKGLQKLRWYCQMCQKQCRDENGFKCHTTSEGHQRQLLLFAEDPDKYLDSFSEEFFDGYLSLLKRRFGTKRVHANNVYQEYIHDREHVHMNATKWETLTEFVKWLGKEGHCIVDETEKGWYVAYVDRDPETLLKQQRKQKREKFEKDEEERFQDFINKQVEMGQLKGQKGKEEFTELKREDEESAIRLNLQLASKAKEAAKDLKKESLINPLKLLSSQKVKEKKKETNAPKKRSAFLDLIEEEQRRKKQQKPDSPAEEANSKIKAEPPWIAKNIIVKVITKELGSKYYKEKGVVRDVIDNYVAIIKLIDCGTKLKLDQVHLETVVPNIGRDVLILSGKYKGMRAILKSIEEHKFSASLEIISEPYTKKIVTEIPYEHFSKLFVDK
ncbi:DNA/RNA-binding protein KIN17 [Armadillidium vulgare]|nr:DNA/RNA-binding protein KIN17 [Armadillidium vulgare]